MILGSGVRKVVFLHGWGGSTKSFESVARRIQDCSCYLIDLYGFGKSDLPYVMDIYEYATQLYLFFVDNKIDECTIIAHSFGGRIAKILCSCFNLNVTKLILVDSAGLKYRPNIIKKVKILSYKLMKKLVKFHILPANVLKKFGSKDYQNAKSYLKISFVKVVNQYLDYLIKYISIPTLIVWGTKDKQTPLYMAKKMNKIIADSGVVFYQNSGHFSYLENLNNFCVVVNNFIRSGV